jgi:hypothetical protein
MLLQPPPLPTGTCKTTTRPTKINLQPGKVTVTNHHFTISTAQPSYCFKKMMLKEVICTFCTTSSNGAEGKKVTKGNKANHNKRQMNQLCPFATRTVHGETDCQQHILLQIVTDKTETNTVRIQAL